MPIRVYKLAKELGVTSKDVMGEALNHGIEVQNHMGSLTEAQANVIRAFLYVPPPVEEKKPAAKKKVAKKKVAKQLSEVDQTPEVSPVEAETNADSDQMIELKPVSPPGRRYDVAPEPVEEIIEVQEEPEAPTAPVETAPATPELQVSMGNIGSAIVNPSAPKAAAPADTSEEVTKKDADDGKVREIKVAPGGAGGGKVFASKRLSHIDENKPTKELPKRRQATILGRKELPKAKPAGGPKSRDGNAPASTTPEDGLTQTKAVGSKRTFVRSPHRGGRGGGAGRGGGFGSPGGAFGNRGGGRRGNQFNRPPKRAMKPIERPESIEIQLPITVKDLSSAMALKSALIIEQLIKNHGILPSINTMLDKETVELIGIEFDCEINVTEKNLEQEFTQEEVDVWEGEDSDLITRAPIVTFLGHVDHGKTSLVDYIRKTRIAEREHGGITQHVGAYRVERPSGGLVFLDTPGHRAFTEMRARGAQVTDLVVLVVAADDGVKPQTEEAISHAKAAGTAIVVAINKCDKPDANVMQVKQQLSGLGLQPEDWGGETVCVEVSALTGQGIDDLLESISLVAEIMELKANPKRPGVATVIESLQKKGEGNVARVLITDGTLKRGDSFLCGHVFGKIKSLRLPDGKTAKEIGPAWPAEISGLAELPAAGDRFFVVKDLAKAKSLADERQEHLRENRLAARQNTNLENLLKKANTDQFNLIVKADTIGSLEVLKKEILALTHDEVEPKIIHAAVGGVTDTDVTLADASEAVIMGFCVTDSKSARALSDERGVEIRHYSVIYNMLDEIKEAMEGKLAPELKESITGHIAVLKTFKISRVGTIAGCIVEDGLIRNSASIRVTRDGILIHEGKLASLRHVKDDVKEIKEGAECGIRLQNYDDVKVGDIFEPFEIEKIKRTLDD
ncbi:MAG: translation initiation factor IF-2 [Planctomycetota bacterium]|jgi:translation initiation factor IF-2